LISTSLASIITSFPGLEPILGARLLGELGDDPHRFTDDRGVRSFAGTPPSGRGVSDAARQDLRVG
jgi:transposase